MNVRGGRGVRRRREEGSWIMEIRILGIKLQTL
jgi:hypothetical protein